MSDEAAKNSPSGSVERVAFDLMEKIAYRERNDASQSRDYFLDLYSDCHHVVKYGTRREKMGY